MRRGRTPFRQILRSAAALLGPGRPLLPGEDAYLASLFGATAGAAGSLPLADLVIKGGGQPFGRCAWQPLGSILQFADAMFEAEDPRRPLRAQAHPVLAHEAFHVWQRRHRRTRSVPLEGIALGVGDALLGAGRAYRYDRTQSDPVTVLRAFTSPATNIEAQAAMFEDYARDPADPRFARVGAYVRDPGQLPRLLMPDAGNDRAV